MRTEIIIKDFDTINEDFLREIRNLIYEARLKVAAAVNFEITLLYWQIGKRILSETLKNSRAEYGKKIISTLSRQLVLEYGKGYSVKNLRHMIKFAQVLQDKEIVSTLSRQLSWSHFKEIIYLTDPLQQQFYTEMCRIERWSVRTLRERINSMLYERTALSKKPKELIEIEIKKIRESEKVSPDIILKDPYFLDFLGLKDHYIEKDLEDAILREIELFILELGAGFTFIERQKRITIDNEDFYIDLLFYNRKLRKLIVIDLKIGNFKAEYKGQMELYLRWLDKYEKQSDEEVPLGIILCTGKKTEQIELLELDKTGIHVAEYLTVLPPKRILQKKLQSAIVSSKERFEKNVLLVN
ncbi:MAG: PDDEXK nuclease domain-containing protein [FCB group bacterium]|jgi:predicted nuclease of restriction endonuclease-like (RecB) superfamily